MGFIYRLEDMVLGGLSRLLDVAVLPTLARLIFLGTLAVFFWNSAQTKIGDGIFSPSVGAYAQIFPKQMEAAGFDPSQLPAYAKYVVMLGTWGEFLIPALVVLGLFTRAASLAMIGFILVMSFVDVFGHGVDSATIGTWFDRDPYAHILDQRAFWIFLLLFLVARGGGALSLDAVLGGNRRVPQHI